MSVLIIWPEVHMVAPPDPSSWGTYAVGWPGLHRERSKKQPVSVVGVPGRVGGCLEWLSVTSASSPSSQEPCCRTCPAWGPQLSHAGLPAEDSGPAQPTPGLPQQEP